MFSSLQSSIMGEGTYDNEFINSAQERSSIYRFLINYSVQLILNKYHQNLNSKDLEQINKDYKHYLNDFTMFIENLMIRTTSSFQDFQKVVIILNKLLKLNEIKKVKLSLTLKQVLLALLIKLNDPAVSGSRYNWRAISGYNKEQLVLLLKHVDHVPEFFENKGENDASNGNDNDNNDLMKINNQDLDKLNSLMRNLVYTNFEVVH